jgi:uncharacterized SAM-dependent methyltransferase
VLLSEHTFSSRQKMKDIRQDFLLRFKSSCEAGMKGLLAPYCYGAWPDQYAGSQTASGTGYDFMQLDSTLIQVALDNGLGKQLPESFHALEYGPGSETAIRLKSALLLKHLLKTRASEQCTYTAIDFSEDFAQGAAQQIKQQVGIKTLAVCEDFMASPPAFSKKDPLLALVFGGSLANAVDLGKGGLFEAHKTLSQLKKSLLTSSYLLMTADVDQDQQRLMQRYQSNPLFEAFFYSVFDAGLQCKAIQSLPENIRDCWLLKIEYDPQDAVLHFILQCRKKHSIHFYDGSTCHFAPGDFFTPLLSHKWNLSTYTSLLKRSGFSLVASWKHPARPHHLVLVQGN